MNPILPQPSKGAPPSMPDTTARGQAHLPSQEKPGTRDGFGSSASASIPEGWFQAPFKSHISRFRLEETPSGLDLHVVFKAKTGEGPEWAYSFSAVQGRAIFEEMRGSPHPHGEVLRPKVIKAGIPARHIRG